jgi:predicted nucleic acid-binding protein
VSPAVLDASAVVALLLDSGPAGRWVAEEVAGRALVAPELVLYETANVMRRQALAGHVSHVEAGLAHQDLQDLALDLWPYRACAARVWELRQTLTVYDAAYVAVAEQVGGDLLTLDARLARASGPRCAVRTPVERSSPGQPPLT